MYSSSSCATVFVSVFGFSALVLKIAAVHSAYQATPVGSSQSPQGYSLLSGVPEWSPQRSLYQGLLGTPSGVHNHQRKE